MFSYNTIHSDLNKLKLVGFETNVTQTLLHNIGASIVKDNNFKDGLLYKLEIVIGNHHTKCRLEEHLINGKFITKYYEDDDLILESEPRESFVLPSKTWEITQNVMSIDIKNEIKLFSG